MHVIIIGGGLVGLAIALGLQKRGISYVVLERRSDQERNWAVTITWSRAHLENLLPTECYEQLGKCLPDSSWLEKENKPEEVLIKDGKTGSTMIKIPFPGILRLNIKKTRQLWSRYVKNMKVGARVTSIEMTSDGPVAILDDGTREHGTVVVGADGSGSYTRRWLLGDEAEPEVLPAKMINVSLSYTAEQASFIESKIHPILELGIHPKSMYMGVLLLDKPDPSRPETWTFYLLSSWPDTFQIEGEESLSRLEQLRLRMDDWAEPFKSAVAWMPDNADIRPEVIKIWSPKLWNNHGGRVTIVGDAAHSMTWHRGQGANNGFADAANFVQAIEKVAKGDDSLQSAMDAVDQDTRARGETEVKISKTQTEASHNHAEYLKSPVFKYGVDPAK